MGPSRQIKTVARKLGDNRGPLLAHWGLVLNEPADILFEIVPVSSGRWLRPKLKLVVTTAGPALNRKLAAFWEIDHLGLYTTLDDEEIQAIAESYILKNPNYKLIGNNCQDFVKALFKGIIDTGRSGDDGEIEEAIDTLETSPPAKSLDGLNDTMLMGLNENLEKQNMPRLEDLLNIWVQELYAGLVEEEDS